MNAKKLDGLLFFYFLLFVLDYLEKKLFFTLFLLVANTKSYAIDKTLLCSGIKRTGGKITRQESIDFNLTFDGETQRITSIPTFFTGEGFGSLPLIQD